MAKQVGEFEVEVSTGGYPVWVAIRHEGGEIRNIRHDDLRDLEYAVQSAIKAANDQLRQVKQEMI